MPYKADIEVRVDGLLKDLEDFRKHLRRNAQFGVDKVLNVSVEELKSSMLTVLNRDIRVSSTVPNAPANIPEKLNIPKAKADVIKEVFGADIKASEIFNKGYTVDDTSNVFVVKNRRVKVWQSVTDSSTYSGQEQMFRDRLEKGIIIDADSGKVYKVNPNTVQGLKLECSRDTGQTVDSEKKFEAYKNSPNVSRRKYDAPYDRTAVWTIRQEDVSEMMKTAIPLEGVIERIQDGDYEIAKNVLNSYNTSGRLDDIIENISTLQQEGPVTEDMANYQVIRDMVNNLKIRKEISDATGTSGVTVYTLFTRYDRTDAEEEVEFFNKLKIQVGLWMASNEERWFKAILRAIEKAIEKYDPQAKFK